MAPSVTSPPWFASGAVVTTDYLPWARVTAHSFLAHNPSSRFVVLVTDEPAAGQLRPDDRFELVRPDEVGLPEAELRWMTLIYDGLELCCALKPWLMLHLLEQADAALYLDSDMYVQGSLSDVATQAARAGVVLSPHALEPRANDGVMPGDDNLLEVGQFNGGFVAAGQRGRPFLRWWAERLARECTCWDPTEPLRFLDQRWLDLVVNYFPFEVDRDPGGNVARWNLPQRALRSTERGFEVDGGPLRFFHFSGFDPANPMALSPLPNPPACVDPARSPAVARLAENYARELLDAGWQPRSGARVTPETAGIPLTRPVRAAIRGALVAAQHAGVAPHAGPEPEPLLAWLRAPVTGGGTPWYLWGLWRSHAGVRATFPQVPGADEFRYQQWSVSEGPRLGLVPPALAGPAAPIRLDGARAFRALIGVEELLDDPTLLAGLAETFTAADALTLLLRAPGRDGATLVRQLEPVLAAAGLAGPQAPDLLALVDAAGAGAVAPLVHAVLSRRTPEPAFATLPHAHDAPALRRLLDGPLADSPGRAPALGFPLHRPVVTATTIP